MRRIVKFSRRFLPMLFSAALLCSFAGAARPAEVGNSDQFVSVTGTISESDVATFADLARSLGSRFDIVFVDLDSPGGDPLAAMEIGEVVRKEGMQTVVRPPSKCLSACVLILAAGMVRIPDDHAMVGIHRPRFDERPFAGLDRNQAKAMYDELAQRVRVYLAEMGMSDQLFLEMMQVPSNKIRMLTFAEMDRFSLYGEDPAYAEWRRAKMIVKYGERKVAEHDRWDDRYNAFVNRCVQTAGRSEFDCGLEFKDRYPDPLGDK